MPTSKVENKKHQKVKNILHNNIPKMFSRGTRSYAVSSVAVPKKGNKSAIRSSIRSMIEKETENQGK